ncbi:Uncharacterised protein [Achromobacter sp. 2789STDY5608621]|nr:Uncharacterised protein [Achromobacter sp. 2789STDY5608621]
MRLLGGIHSRRLGFIEAPGILDAHGWRIGQAFGLPPDGGIVCGNRVFFCARKRGFYAIIRRDGGAVVRNRQFRPWNTGLHTGLGKGALPFAILGDGSGIRAFDGISTLHGISALDGIRGIIGIGGINAFGGVGGIRQLLHFAQVQAGQRGGGMRRFQRGQFIQRAQAEVIEELARGAEQGRTAGRVAVADDFDPAPVLQRLHDVRRHGHAADVLDIAARHRLAPGHNGQGFHHRAGILGRLLGIEPFQIALHVRAALEPPPRRQLHQLQAAIGPVVLQRFQQRAQGAVVELFIIPEQLAHFGQLHRLHRAKQRGFQHEYRLAIVHRDSNSKRANLR